MPTETPPCINSEIERLVSAYANLILRLAYARLGSTHAAQDICQQVFLKLVDLGKRGLATFATPEHEKAWVIRATINACINEQQSGWSRRVVPLPLSNECEPRGQSTVACANDPAELLETAEAHKQANAQVHAALELLPPAQRQAVYLRYYEGYAVQDIAELTDETPNTVSQHLSRARAKLRDLLEGDAQ